MPGRKDNTLCFLFLLAAVIVAISCCTLQAADIFSRKEKAKSSSEPTLYLAPPDSNDTKMVIADSNIISKAVSLKAADTNSPPAAKLNLVVATHGWIEKKPWPKALALTIKTKVGSQRWLCGWYDWRDQSKRINPIDTAKYARNVAGPLLGKKIIKLSRDWQHIHLIGHSAGSWIINEAAKTIASQTDATIHLTFLDAYVPPFWHEDELGDFTSDTNVVYWADHYFTRDLTLGATEKNLSYAHNVDLTDITPGVNDHKFPHYWYHATVIGRYAAGQKYEGKELFTTFDSIEYGFARSLEAGRQNWKANTALKHGNKPVKLKRPKKPLDLQLKELFKKHKK